MGWTSWIPDPRKPASDFVDGVKRDVGKVYDWATDKPNLPDPNHQTIGGGGQWGNLGQRRAADVSRRQAPTSPWETDQRYLADHLRGQMSGQSSLSREQLRQDSGRNIAMQQALAASAGPQNAAMAQRMASQNAGRINQGMAGQAAMAGIAERNAAAQALGGLAGQARGQDQRGYFDQQSANDAAWLGAQNIGLSAAQSQLNADMQAEQLRMQAALAEAGQATNFEKMVGGGVKGLEIYNQMYPATPSAPSTPSKPSWE